MNRQRAITIFLKIIVFVLSFSSASTVFAIISYANYALFKDTIITTILTYIGAFAIALATFYFISSYLTKLISSLRRKPMTNSLIMIRGTSNNCSSGSCYTKQEEKPSFLRPYKPTNRR